MDNIIKDIKDLRVAIDCHINGAQAVAERIARGDGGREMSLCITKLQEAKMWAGMALGQRGHLLPQEYRDEYLAVDDLMIKSEE